MPVDASTATEYVPLPTTESAFIHIYHVAHGGVAICALAGALFYLVNSSLPTQKQKLVYTFVSFVFGCFAAPVIADLLAATVQRTAGLTLQADLEIGALAGAAGCVRLMQLVGNYLPFGKPHQPGEAHEP